MKTKPSFRLGRSLPLILCASVSVPVVYSQPSEPVPPPPAYSNDNREPANYPLPKSAREGDQPGVVTPQRFMSEAVWTGMRQVRFAEIATRRTMDSQVRLLAQSISADHSKLNIELRAVARRKNYQAPENDGLQVTNVTPNLTSIRQQERLLRSVAPDTNAADRVRRDVVGDARREPVRDADPARPSTQRTNEFSDVASSQALVTNVRLLEIAKDAEFDRTYLAMVRGEYSKSVPVFEAASRQTEDNELQQFAAATLIKLREYEKRIETLARSAKPVVNNTGSAGEPVR